VATTVEVPLILTPLLVLRYILIGRVDEAAPMASVDTYPVDIPELFTSVPSTWFINNVLNAAVGTSFKLAYPFACKNVEKAALVGANKVYVPDWLRVVDNPALSTAALRLLRSLSDEIF